MTWETCDRRPMIQALAQNAKGVARILCVQMPVCVPAFFLRRPGQFLNWFNTPTIEKIYPNLFLFRPYTFLPERFPGNMRLNSLFYHEFSRRIERALRRVGMGNGRRIAWVFKPDQLKWLGLIAEDYIVYECHDEYQLDIAPSGLIPLMREQEMALLSKADLVLATSQVLEQKRRQWHSNVHFVPNGADIDHFGRALDEGTPVALELNGLKRPIIGYPGNLSRFVDINLLCYLAEMRPNWSFVLLGQVADGISPQELQKRPNVHMLGWQPYARLPNFSKGFDVVMLPFLVNEYVDCSNPLILWEQMAAGKRIVCTNFREALDHADVVWVGDNKENFLSCVENALSAPHCERVNRGLQVVAERSWNVVTQRSIELLIKEIKV
jgi:hypothetical protein